MYSSLQPFFEWAGRTWVGATISGSTWLFPAVETVHIVALALLFGAIVVLDMRLCGLTMTMKPVQQLYRELAPWIFTSLTGILITGSALFAAEPMKAYHSGPFQTKMVLLATAITFHYTLWRKVAMAPSHRPILCKATATLSLALWLSVGLAGRAIGFF